MRRIETPFPHKPENWIVSITSPLDLTVLPLPSVQALFWTPSPSYLWIFTTQFLKEFYKPWDIFPATESG